MKELKAETEVLLSPPEFFIARRIKSNVNKEGCSVENCKIQFYTQNVVENKKIASGEYYSPFQSVL